MHITRIYTITFKSMEFTTVWSSITLKNFSTIKKEKLEETLHTGSTDFMMLNRLWISVIKVSRSLKNFLTVVMSFHKNTKINTKKQAQFK